MDSLYIGLCHIELQISSVVDGKKNRSCKYSLRKTVRKVSPILVTLTSRNNSDCQSSNVSLKENKPDGVNTISTTTFERMKKKVDGFRQTE